MTNDYVGCGFGWIYRAVVPSSSVGSVIVVAVEALCCSVSIADDSFRVDYVEVLVGVTEGLYCVSSCVSGEVCAEAAGPANFD